MIAVIVTFRLAPDGVARFRELVAEQAATSLREEPGCRRFDVWTSGEAPDVVHLYELYDDRAAFFDIHLDSPHFKAFDAAAAALVLEKTVAVYDQPLAL